MATPSENTPMVVTGCGLVTSLGLDVANSCAAARAGIVRATSMDVYPVRSSADGSIGGVSCHSVSLLTDGFEGDARLIRLLQGGFEDLLRQCSHAPWKTKRTAFYLSIPGTNRLFSGVELVAEEDERKTMQEAEKAAANSRSGLERARRLLSEGARRAEWPGELELRWSTDSGNTGVAEALQRASHDLRSGMCELAIVGGVDSLLDEDTLGWLELTGRLKTPDRAAGLQPGEAAGFLILECRSAAASRRAPVLAVLENLCFGEEGHSMLSGDRSSGIGSSKLVFEATERNLRNRSGPAWLIHDLNGEAYRAEEWGAALFRLTSMSQAFAEPKVWFPAAWFGDAGAATGAVHACVAVKAFERAYAPASIVGIVSSGLGSLRSCWAMHPDDAAPSR